MPLEQRELAPGTKLVGTHKKTTYVCEVVETEEGLRYRLEDGKIFKSPSSAGKAVMGGVSCNGWRFWSLEGTQPERAPKVERPKAPAAATKTLRQIRKLRNQKGAPEGQTVWFCSACMAAFNRPTGEEPATCNEGHPWEARDEFASTD